MPLRLTYKQAILSLFLLHLLALGLFAGFRIIDPDEGFYLTAARKVAQGNSLYSDFFYPQMPFLPYILAPLSGHGFATLYLSRAASVAASLFAAVLFYLLLNRLCRSQNTEIFILALYLFSGPILTWHSVAKTYPWTDLFLLGTVYLLLKSQASGKMWPLLAAGIGTALAINTRLVFLPLAALFGLFIIRASHTHPLRRLVAFISVVAVISIPSIVLLSRYPNQFLFDNFGFHLMRDPQTFFPQTIIDRLVVLARMIANPQLLVILTLAGAAYLTWRKSNKTIDLKLIAGSPVGLLALTGLAIIAIYLLPFPIHQEYFVQAVPFVLLAAAAGLSEAAAGVAKFIIRPRVRFALTAFYLLGVIPYGVIFILGVRPLDRFNSIANVHRVCSYLQSGQALGPVLAEWPLFPTLANCESLDDAAFIGYNYKLPLTDDQKRLYRLPTDSGMIALLSDRTIARLVVRDFPDSALQPMVAQNYVKEKSFDRYVVYGRK